MALSTASAATQRLSCTMARRAAAVLQPAVFVRCCSMCARPRGTLTHAAAVAASSWTAPRLESFVSIEPPAPVMPQLAAAATDSPLRSTAFAGSSHWRHAAALRSTSLSAPRTAFSAATHFVLPTAARAFSSSSAAAAAARSDPASSAAAPPSPPPQPQPQPQPQHLDTIHLHGLEFFSYHGVYPEETRSGQPFRIDLDLVADLSAPARSDQLDQTINYAAVFARVASIMTGPRLHKLLESLCVRIIDDLLASFPALHSVQVKLAKPKVAIPGSLHYAGVTIRRTRLQREHDRQQQQQSSATSST